MTTITPQKELSIEEILSDFGSAWRLILYNDDYNTFDWVIDSLMAVCEHSFEQAEQCSLIVHYKGKCVIKEGTKEKLQQMREALIDRGLNVTLESI